MKRKYLFLTIVLNFAFFFSYSQQDCTSALPVCSDANSGGLVDGYGSDDFMGATSSGCLQNGLGVQTIETNSYWFRIRMAASGEFGFSIKPNDASEDWDFAVYGPNADCGSLGEPIACNFSKVSPTGYTGVGLDPISGTQTAAYDDWMDVNTGEEYLILINQYSGNNAGFDITWEGAVIAANTDPLDCSILVDLGPDRVLCDGDTTTLNATIFGSTVTYLWTVFNETTGNFEEFSPSQTAATLDVTTTGRYMVEVTDLITNEVREDDIEITFAAVPIAGVADDIILCDNDNDGFENFDLESRTAQIINGQANMAVTYHEFDLFAEVGADPQASPYFSDSKTIWARIYNIDNPDCYDITSFELVATGQLLPVQPPDLSACDNDTDGETYFDLDAQTSIILNGQSGFITYYENETLAIDRKGWILDTNAYLTGTRTVWVRVEVSPGSDCFEILSFEINVSVLPEVFIAEDILECDDNNDGIGVFDLNVLKDLEIAGHQNLNDFDIFYYSSPFDADADQNRILQPYQTITPYAEELIYARIQAKNVPECFQVSSFSVQVFDTPSPTPSDEMTSLTYCDDISDGDDTNGLFNFDLTEKATEILNGQSPFVFDIEYYQDIDYLNQIADPTNYVNSIVGGETIYVRVLNGNPNNVSCIAETSFFIEVRPLPLAISAYTLMQCDEDASPDGITSFKLSEADDYIRLGDETLEVSYHLTSSDAATGLNSIDKSSFSNSVASTVYARVLAPNGCYRIVDVSLESSITDFPPNYIRRFVSCDSDDISDGKSVFDLTTATSEIISLFNSQNLRVSFYRNEDDALSEVNPIAEPTLYENEVEFFQIIWVRVESALDGGCFGVGPVVELVINRRPNFELIESAFVCLNNTPLNVTVENPEGIYNYSWTNQSGEVISLVENVQIYEAGVYTVVATSVAGCDSFPQQIEIFASEIPSLTSDDITVVENSDINSITIRNDGQNLGVGDYEFSLDDPDGFYQDDNVFYNVIPGRHTVYVRDKNGCGLAQQVVNILGFPKFFTPNEDGINDYWNVLGINSTDYPEVVVYIFDRHGKHLTTIDGNSIGWNGIYNGSKSISSDYWYLAELTDSGGNLSQYKGHFSLIRR